MKQALITGVIGGVGRVLARTLGRKGWAVQGICHRRDSRSAELQRRARDEGWTLHLLEADAADFASVEQIIPEIEKAASDLDAFVHLAAPHLKLLPFRRELPEDFDAQWQVGARFAARLCGALSRPMMRRGSGHLIFVLSSVTLGFPPKGMASYVTGKYALLGLAKALAAEYSPPLCVSCFSPRAMDTDFLAELPEAAKRLLTDSAEATKGFLPVERLAQRIVERMENVMPSSHPDNLLVD